METFHLREETERRRLMTDEERALEDTKIGKYKREEKSSYRFMQKYYHVGAFADKDDELFKRDYNIAVGTDLFDKSNLPGAKQVRRGWEFKKGQSKYTHLTDMDTTLFDPYTKPNENILTSFQNRQAGLKGGDLERPTKFKKL